MQAYLQRGLNSGGRIGSEDAVGRGRADLLVEWRQGGEQGPARTRKHVIERKVRTGKSGLDRLIHEGREQTASYMEICGAESGHLVIFHMRPNRSWKEQVLRRDPESGGSPVTVWGM